MKPTEDRQEYQGVVHGLHHHEPLYTDELHNEDVAHEHTDVNVRALLLFCIGLVVVTGAVMAGMWGLFTVFENMAARNDPVLSPHATPAGQLPPEPRLLLDEPQNLETLRASEADSLQTYGWVDQPGGAARLPIAEAKKLLLQRGLPVRDEAPADAWIGTRATGASRGESSSGRAIPLQRTGGQ